nr:EOG090X0P2R [Lepidurus arcticus]
MATEHKFVVPQEPREEPEGSEQHDNDPAAREAQQSAKDLEKQEEAKLKAKLAQGRPLAGQSAFLQKRLNKGQKYFDSGDYQMAKQKVPTTGQIQPARPSPVGIPQSTGETIPTPDSMPIRKTSIVQSKLASPAM